MSRENPLVAFGFKPISNTEHMERTAAQRNLMREKAKVEVPPPMKRPVGRPKKQKVIEEVLHVSDSSDSDVDTMPARKKPRNRPKTYTNWFTSDLWPKIHHAMVLHGWTRRTAVKYLQDHYKKIGYKSPFKGLNESTVRSWLGPSKHDWKSKVKQAVEALMEEPITGASAARKVMYVGGNSVWKGHKALESEFIEVLAKLRVADAPLNSIIISLQMKAFLAIKAPEMLTENGGAFEVSRSHVCTWMRQRLKWSYRKPTGNTSKLPRDWEKQGHKMILRIAYLVAVHHIPMELVVNADQIGVLLMLVGDDGTYAKRGQKKIVVSGRGDKRQVSLMPSFAASGDLLPFQVIFKGSKRDRILPKGPSATLLRQAGFHLTLTSNHWSNVQTMKDFVNFVFVPYVQRRIFELGLNQKTQKSILLVDSYVVHTSVEFNEWMRVTHPTVCYLFIPANCTSHLQPCDVVLQRPIKCAIHQEFKEYSVKSLQDQMASRIQPEDCKLETHVDPLRNLLCDWLWKAYIQVLPRRSMLSFGWKKVGILKAWENLTQSEALVAVGNTKESDPLFGATEMANTLDEDQVNSDGKWFGDSQVGEMLTRCIDAPSMQDFDLISDEEDEGDIGKEKEADITSFYNGASTLKTIEDEEENWLQ